jgi:general secretion pathway protein N
MTRAQLLLAGFLVYATVLLVTAPASLIDAGLRRWSVERIRLADARGMLWSGSGQLELRGPDASALFSTSVNWQPNRGAWFSPQLEWRVEFAGSAQPLQVAVSLRHIELENLTIEVPAAAVSALLPASGGYGLGGILRLSSARLKFGAGSGGSAHLQWIGASTVLAPVAPLGSYELLVVADSGDMVLSLRTLSGPLQLDGTGTILAAGKLVYEIKASVLPPEMEQLVPFLQLIAVQENEGSFLLQRK